MGNFKELNVWQLSSNMAVEIYQITNTNNLLSKDYGLKDQMRRSAVSIASNIAEGNELDTNKQSVRHFYIAKGSIAELITQIKIARAIGYLKEDTSNPLIDTCHHISIMLHKLIKARKL